MNPTFCTWFDLDKFVVLKIPLDFTRFLEMVEDIFVFVLKAVEAGRQLTFLTIR